MRNFQLFPFPWGNEIRWIVPPPPPLKRGVTFFAATSASPPLRFPPRLISPSFPPLAGKAEKITFLPLFSPPLGVARLRTPFFPFFPFTSTQADRQVGYPRSLLFFKSRNFSTFPFLHPAKGAGGHAFPFPPTTSTSPLLQQKRKEFFSFFKLAYSNLFTHVLPKIRELGEFGLSLSKSGSPHSQTARSCFLPRGQNSAPLFFSRPRVQAFLQGQFPFPFFPVP